ncbi:MAG: TonB-dependent receptor plug domain-containing protein, partial [Bacteroidota bacterium]
IEQFIHLHEDKVINIQLEHSINMLDGVIVTGETVERSTQSAEVFREQYITDNADENLANLLSAMTGVSSLKTGTAVAKPIVHGLYGNRLTVLNNGIAQAGQQWGNDHGLEIDPLVAQKIRVIKGVSTLEYVGANLGGIVLVEPAAIGREPHLHGRAKYFYETNGRTHGANLQMQQYNNALAWKINGTFKQGGDRHTPNYFLRNTGLKEANIAFQLERSHSERFSTQLYASSFNTEVGILRGSHIGNLTDLSNAFTRTVPFFTEEEFSYEIDVPKQKVNHHLAKLQSKYFIDSEKLLVFTIASQLNLRKEFDIRRGRRSEKPALSLRQWSHFAEVKYKQDRGERGQFRTGLQFNAIDNTNVPGTGVSPLIPNYIAYETGIFAVWTKQLGRSLVEFGARYDNVIQKVVAISREEIPFTIVRYSNLYHNGGTSIGWTYAFNNRLQFSANTGWSTRSPAINELYSNGLHQGVSAIEEGSVTLRQESSLKTTMALNGKLGKWLSFETLVYYQNINNYIYLQPQQEPRLTIRGAFPLFLYEQTDAQIYGLDARAEMQLSSRWRTQLSYSYIRGTDRSNNQPLIYMPSNTINGTLSYESMTDIRLGKHKLKGLTWSVSNDYVFEQTHLLPEQDFAAPPKGYYLLGGQVATDIQLERTLLRFSVKVDNALNLSYRDYLNRQRYFSDEMGRNVILGLGIRF